MPIPNVSTLYQRIKRGSEGGREFARIIDLLLIADSKENNYPFTAFDDEMGDAFGVDSFGGTGYRDTSGMMGYQYKFFPSPLSSQQRSTVKSSLKKAVEQFPDLQRWILITPEDFFRKDTEWFEELGHEYRYPNRGPGVYLEHWGHKKIIELMLRFPHIARSYYSELFSFPESSITIGNIKMDTEECDWYRILFTDHIKHQHMPYYMKFIRVNDFVVHYQQLEPQDREMFESVCHYLQSRVLQIPALPKELLEFRTFLGLDPATFYKSMILLNRIGHRLETLDKVYDVRKSDALFGREYSDDFYAYDVAAIKAVRSILPTVWPDQEDYERLAEDGSLGEAIQTFKRGFMRTTNPVFDIVLVNNTPVTQILHRIDIVIESVWSEAKAGPRAQVLRPVITYRFRVDFAEEVNSFELDSPLSFGSEQPVRFKIQLDSFIRDCPGNCARIRFRFVCNDKLVESETLFLDF